MEKLGAADCIAFGSDFDGISRASRGISGIESIEPLSERLFRLGIPKENLQKYFYGNAYNFFRDFWRND